MGKRMKLIDADNLRDEYESLRRYIKEMPVNAPTCTSNELKMWLLGFVECQERIMNIIKGRMDEEIGDGKKE